MSSRKRGGMLRAASMLGAICLAASVAPAACACPQAGSGLYTQAQAMAGMAVFDAHCSACHNADLSGGAGPALAGSQFFASLQFSKMTGAELFDFIRTQMPYDAPGSLTITQYQDALAYILSFNHYPAGPHPLDANSAACLQLLPYPKQG
jgi:mono/diheme cytochrome c family protein